MRKGQFMILSVIIASLIITALSTTISQMQLDRYDTETTSKHVNMLENEIQQITSDGTISRQEERNFRKLLEYNDQYTITAEFNHTEPCIILEMEKTDRTIETDCIS